MTSIQLKHFADVVKPFVKKSKQDVAEVRRYSQKQAKARDWPWNRFVHAFASNGGSRHWDENIYPNLETQYNWTAIARLSPNERRKRLTNATNPRRRERLGPYFEQSYQCIKKAGGPQAIKKQYNAITTARERIAFWKSFPGIGDKYAREIPMRSYDPFFRNGHFAVDARLKRLLSKLFKQQLNYNDAEKFFVSAANRLRVDCWTLDTVLYNNYLEISAELSRRVRA